MIREPRHASGSVRFDKRRRTWNYLWYESGKRRSKLIGTKQQFPTKARAWKEAERLKPQPSEKTTGETVQSVITRYEAERMPARLSTARTYRSFLKNHVTPKWRNTLIKDVQPRPVELWLRDLPLAPKSKTHVRSLMHGLVEFAMWAGLLDIGRNPVSLVQNKGASRKVRKARSLTVEQFHSLLKELAEPFATLALLCVCLGLRISEALALRWSDVDWLDSRLSIRRGIVAQVVDDVKTESSAKTFVLSEDLLSRLKAWKQSSQFRAAGDWMFASPHKIGRLPYSYTGIRRILGDASEAAGLGHITTHSFRHSFRTWLNQTGAPIGTQQKLMRHSTVAMTMDTYGTVFDKELTAASSKVAELAFQGNGAQAERKSS
jgi:integrase